MSRMKKSVGLAAVVAIVAAFGISTAVFAQTATPPATSTAPQAHMEMGHGGTRGVCGQAGLDAAAKALKLTTTELESQLWGGQTLSGLADKAGVKLADVQSAVQAACQQTQIDAINQAVKDGTMTQAKADWLIEGITKGYIGGQGDFGMGFGMGKGGFEMGGRGARGGRGGHGGFGLPNGAAPQGTAPNSGGTTTPNSFSF
jgi:hypothetical protein